MHRWLAFLCAISWLALASAPAAAPFVPASDDVVVERLPERTDPALKELRRMRATLAAHPEDVALATTVARRALAAARASGDPRFLGQAQAALAPWWSAADAPVSALLLRATLKQSQHDFDGALSDLDALLVRDPSNAQALLTRATIATVQGRYVKARGDCARLARLASPLVATTCLAGAASLDGGAEAAARALDLALARDREPAEVRVWALTVAAEIAARRGDAAAAESRFRAALAADAADPYLRGAYADFLLDAGRAREARALVADATRNDALLLRLALAERALPECAEAFAAHRADLAARFDAARARGDAVHRREEARFRLAIEGDAAGALALARANWSVQREPADLRVLADAARAARDRATLAEVGRWVDGHRGSDGAAGAAR